MVWAELPTSASGLACWMRELSSVEMPDSPARSAAMGAAAAVRFTVAGTRMAASPSSRSANNRGQRTGYSSASSFDTPAYATASWLYCARSVSASLAASACCAESRSPSMPVTCVRKAPRLMVDSAPGANVRGQYRSVTPSTGPADGGATAKFV